jgi:hypothetical protein
MGTLVRGDYSPSSLLNSVRAIFSVRSNSSSERAAQSQSNNQENVSNNVNIKTDDIVSEVAAPEHERDSSRHSGSSNFVLHKAKTTLSEHVDQEDIVAFGGSTDAHPMQSREHVNI